MAKKRTHFLIEGLFGFEGRMRRSEFWLMSIGVGVIKFVLALVISGLMGLAVTDPRGSYVRIGLDVLFFWPALAFAVKRGHDRNRSTAYSIALTVIMAALGFAMIALAAPVTAAGANVDMGAVGVLALVWLIYVAVLIYWFVDYGCLDGTKGRNRFGASPKGLKGPGDKDVSEAFA